MVGVQKVWHRSRHHTPKRPNRGPEAAYPFVDPKHKGRSWRERREHQSAASHEKVAADVERLSLEIYLVAATRAEEVGIILADTKFEFGLDKAHGNVVVLVDEVLTPDSSRFWPKESWEAHLGKAQPSFDKQFLRDWLTSNGLKGKEQVTVPTDIVEQTAQKYKEACEMLTGQKA